MDGVTWPGTALADLSENEISELSRIIAEPVQGDRGGLVQRFGSLLGFWRRPSGFNLRVGLRRGVRFVPPDTTNSADRLQEAELIRAGEAVDLSLRQVHLPDLPHDDCVVQLAWRGTHRFDDQKELEIGHTISCDAKASGTAAAVALPVFIGLRAERQLVLEIGIYAMTDRDSRPVLNLLAAPALRDGLKLAGNFNPAFGMTVPYIQAAIAGLTRLSRKNFKLANWQFGFTLGSGAVPLAVGEYILLDGTIRVGRSTEPLAWPQLRWDDDRQRPTYSDGSFPNPYLILTVTRPPTPPEKTVSPTTAIRSTQARKKK